MGIFNRALSRDFTAEDAEERRGDFEKRKQFAMGSMASSRCGEMGCGVKSQHVSADFSATRDDGEERSPWRSLLRHHWDG